MTKTKFSTVSALVLGLGIATCGVASAQSVTNSWNFGDITPTGACVEATTNAGNFGNRFGCSVQPAGTVEIGRAHV